jgi:hypothetical protein
MRKPIHLLLWPGLFLFAAPLCAQLCPRIVNCPQSTPTYCDFSTNDSLLWNVAPFTYSPTIGNADLHEGAIDLSLKAIGCPDGGIVSISFILYLDLDADDLQETVLTSGSPPPAGRVRANNSFNPGFSGGDTVWFDRRPLPDSLKYRFSLEIAYSGDTTIGYVRFSTDADPYHFVPVQLPEGRHRIEWRMVQDANVRYCDRNFKVKDCQKPLVSCNQNLMVHIDASLTAYLGLDQALAAVSDNITPDTQLLVGMRRVGSGFGFPFDAQGNPQDSVMFNCNMDTEQFIEIWAKDRENNVENCTAQVFPFDTTGFCPFVANPLACARSYWNDEPLYGVSFDLYLGQMQPVLLGTLPPAGNGCGEITDTPPPTAVHVIPSKDTVPLNGVTTYDLVLISRHILASEPFDAGWKMVAADANRSNTITTLDILELRKLILGVTSKLPNNTPSWRFFVDTCMAVHAPFFNSCPESYLMPLIALSDYPPQITFRAVKVGDVNGTAVNTDSIFNTPTISRDASTALLLPDVSLSAGETAFLPLRIAKGDVWEGLQFSMAFDPSLLELEPVSTGGALSLQDEHWAAPEPGVVNLSWSDMRPVLLPENETLLQLRVKARAPLRTSEAIRFQEPNTFLSAEAYNSDGLTLPLELAFSTREIPGISAETEVLPPQPNPVGHSARMPLRMRTANEVTLVVSNMNGEPQWLQETQLEAGSHWLDIPAHAMPLPGVYTWRLQAGSRVWTGKLVKL